MHKLRSALALGVTILVTACSSSGPGSTSAATTGTVDPASAHDGAAGSGATGSSATAGGVTSGGSAGASGGGSSSGIASASGSAGPSGGRGATAGNSGDTTDAGSASADASGLNSPVDGAAMGPWPPVNDYGARGPLTTQRDINTGPGGAYDIFRPTTLGPSPRKNPIISWANGTLFSINNYQMLLDHWASHGFVVIAAHSQSTAGGATHKAGIDWLVAENSRSASIYFGLLDTGAIGAAGHSQGGGATIAAGSNKPGPTGIVATLPLMPILSFETDKTIVMRQTAPMFNINATMDTRDPTGAVANLIFDGSNRELVQAAFIGIHEDAMSAAMRAPTLAWFRLHLMGDDSAKATFYPDKTCGLCQNPAWKQVRYKNTP